MTAHNDFFKWWFAWLTSVLAAVFDFFSLIFSSACWLHLKPYTQVNADTSLHNCRIKCSLKQTHTITFSSSCIIQGISACKHDKQQSVGAIMGRALKPRCNTAAGQQIMIWNHFFKEIKHNLSHYFHHICYCSECGCFVLIIFCQQTCCK